MPSETASVSLFAKRDPSGSNQEPALAAPGPAACGCAARNRGRADSRLVDRQCASVRDQRIRSVGTRHRHRERSPQDRQCLWRDSPAGPGSSWVIEHQPTQGDRPLIVGHHGVIKLDGDCDGSHVRLGKTENTMVLPEHRRRLLYPRRELAMLARYSPEFDAIFTTRGQPDAIRMRGAMGYLRGPRMVTETWVRGIQGRVAAAWPWERSRLGVRHDVGHWDIGPMRGPRWTTRTCADVAIPQRAPRDGRIRITKSLQVL
jgi:hypothetical protein